MCIHYSSHISILKTTSVIRTKVVVIKHSNSMLNEQEGGRTLDRTGNKHITVWNLHKTRSEIRSRTRTYPWNTGGDPIGFPLPLLGPPSGTGAAAPVPPPPLEGPGVGVPWAATPVGRPGSGVLWAAGEAESGEPTSGFVAIAANLKARSFYRFRNQEQLAWWGTSQEC